MARVRAWIVALLVTAGPALCGPATSPPYSSHPLPHQNNDPAPGSIVNCYLEPDRRCLALNKVPIDGKCYSVGTPGPCRENEYVVVDKKLYEEERLLRGTCRPYYTCNRNVFQEYMSYDKNCHEVSDIQKQICSPEKNERLRKNIFGEGECESVLNDNSTPSQANEYITVLQDKQCRAPDLSFEFDYSPVTPQLRFPWLSVPLALLNVSVRCGAEERECLERGLLLVPRGVPNERADPASCHAPLTRGPCPNGAWLVLDRVALEDEGRLAPVCDWPRCDPGSVYLARKQRCVTLWQLQRDECASEDIVFDVFGEAHCSRYTSQEVLLALPTHKQKCSRALSSSSGHALGRDFSAVLTLVALTSLRLLNKMETNAC